MKTDPPSTYIWSELQNRPAGNFHGSIEFKNGYTIHAWHDDETLHLIKVGPDLKKITRVEIEIEHHTMPGRWKLLHVFKLGNQIRVLSAIVDRNTKRVYYYAQTIDYHTIQLVDVPKLISERNYEVHKRRLVESFEVSKNEDQYVFIHSNGNSQTNELEYIVKVFDAKFNVEFSHKIIANLNEDVDKEIKIYVQNETIYLISRFSMAVLDESVSATRKNNYKLTVVNDVETNSHYIKLKDGEISNLSLLVNDQNEVVVSGFYGSAPHKVIGSFYVKKDHSEEFGDVIYNEFSQEFIEAFSHYEQASRIEGESKFEMFDYMVLSFQEVNGNYILMGEQIRGSHVFDSRVNGPDHYFAHGDVIIVSMDSLGHEIRIDRILKYQPSTGIPDPWKSVIQSHWDGKFYFVYNDHLYNYTDYDPANIRPANWDGYKSYTCVASLNENGELKRRRLYNFELNKLATITQDSFPLKYSHKEFLMIAILGDELKFGKIIVLDEDDE